MDTSKWYILFAIVVVAVIAAAYISGKMKLNSYEEFYEENFDSFDEYKEVAPGLYRKAA